MPELSQRSRYTWADWLVVTLALGYISMSRTFAYIGFAPVYIGEISFAAFLFARPNSVIRPWLRSLSGGEMKSGLLAWSVFAVVVYGACQLLRGLADTEVPKLCLQNVVFTMYPIFVFVGIWVGLRQPEMLRRLLRWLAWINGVYGFAYLVLLSHTMQEAPSGEGSVPWFGQPTGAAVALLGLLTFEKRLLRWLLPILLNAFVFLALQVRAEWIGMAASVGLWAGLHRRFSQLLALGVVLTGLLAVGLVTDARIPAPQTHADEISTRYVVGRALSALNPELASNVMGEEAAESWGGTVNWRTGWWGNLWQEVHQSPTRIVFGMSYGYAIWEAHPLELTIPLRTPHCSFMFALAYLGWLGVLLYFGMLTVMAWLLWRTFRKTGQAFGICYLVMIVIWSLFDNLFEAPFGAIPFYLIVGMAMSPLFATRRDIRETAKL